MIFASAAQLQHIFNMFHATLWSDAARYKTVTLHCDGSVSATVGARDLVDISNLDDIDYLPEPFTSACVQRGPVRFYCEDSAQVRKWVKHRKKNDVLRTPFRPAPFEEE